MNKIIFILGVCSIFLLVLPLVFTLNTVNITGYARYFDSGNDVTGNITTIFIESENKSASTFSSGDFYYNLTNIDADNSNYLTVIVDDNQKIGYTQLKIHNENLTEPSCTIQNISLTGHAIDKNTGNNIISGNVIVSILDSSYTNTTSFSSSTWSIDFHPCLISGNIYTLQILITNSTSKGVILMKYPAR